MNSVCRSALLVIFLNLLTVPALAQISELTAEQQVMLNQLPPAQRQQAVQAIRQFQQGNSASSGTNSTLVEPISEPDDSVRDRVSGERPDVVRAGADSQLILTFTQKTDLTPQEEQRLYQFPSLLEIQGSKYYELDEAGRLEFPGLDAIALAGLTQEEIEKRLSAVPEFGVFDISANLLGTGESRLKKLQPFGYDFFDQSSAGFDPVTTGPVPPDYVLGPGDSIRVQLYGNENGTFEHEVSRDGDLMLPQLGPITVAGLTFSEFRRDIDQRVQEMLIGTQVSVTMGQLRTVRVFVLGDVERPGSYVVSSLATISSALYRSGGISLIGSLRNVQLKRSGRLISTLDLYDLLLQGDSSGDARLQSGDVVFVPPVGQQITIDGAVKRPGIYEVENGTPFSEAMRLAGGSDADAFLEGTRVERITKDSRRRVISLDLESADGKKASVEPGDVISVPRALPDLDDSVVLSGHVQRPGPYEWFDGMRLLDLVPSRDALKLGADADYVLIRREDPVSRQIRTLSANLTGALGDSRSPENVRLQAKDTVYVFSLAIGRQRILAPIIDELALQAGLDEPLHVVSVVGEVRAPGRYPLEAGMSVDDLLRASGGLSEEAYSLRAEIARYQVIEGEFRDSEILDIDLAGILRGEPGADVELRSYDNLRISVIPKWDRLWSVTLQGEVRFPGEYRIRDGETLTQILERAGGLTDEAFPEGAVFLRESLREREQEQIDILAKRLEADLTSLSLENADTSGSQTLETGEELLSQLRNTQSVGRLVISPDLLTIADPGSPGALLLRDGDQLLIPKRAQEVTVIGETQQNTSHLHTPGLTLSDYVARSGGLTRRADKKLIYVVRANGAVETGGRSRWFGRKDTIRIRPGDTIVIPLETDRIRPLALWSSVTQILYQAAIALAAVDSFGN